MNALTDLFFYFCFFSSTQFYNLVNGTCIAPSTSVLNCTGNTVEVHDLSLWESNGMECQPCSSGAATCSTLKFSPKNTIALSW